MRLARSIALVVLFAFLVFAPRSWPVVVPLFLIAQGFHLRGEVHRGRHPTRARARR
jgi:hypothetical protein